MLKKQLFTCTLPPPSPMTPPLPPFSFPVLWLAEKCPVSDWHKLGSVAWPELGLFFFLFFLTKELHISCWMVSKSYKSVLKALTQKSAPLSLGHDRRRDGIFLLFTSKQRMGLRYESKKGGITPGSLWSKGTRSFLFLKDCQSAQDPPPPLSLSVSGHNLRFLHQAVLQCALNLFTALPPLPLQNNYAFSTSGLNFLQWVCAPLLLYCWLY